MYSTLPQRYITQQSNTLIQRYTQQWNNRLSSIDHWSGCQRTYQQHIEQQLQRRAQSTSTTTTTTAGKVVNQNVAPEHAGRSAGEAVQNAATSSAPKATATKELPPSFLPTTDRWTKTIGTLGALANWTIPSAAIAHIMSKPPDTIDPKMTATLGIYSCFFMRWALAISPANYPLLVCHICNVVAQSTQLVRYFTLANKSASTSTGATTTSSTSASASDKPTVAATSTRGKTNDASSDLVKKVVPGERKS